MQKYLEISVKAAKGLNGAGREIFDLEVQVLGLALARMFWLQVTGKQYGNLSHKTRNAKVE